jgi:hypothetical protein
LDEFLKLLLNNLRLFLAHVLLRALLAVSKLFDDLLLGKHRRSSSSNLNLNQKWICLNHKQQAHRLLLLKHSWTLLNLLQLCQGSPKGKLLLMPNLLKPPRMTGLLQQLPEE